VRSEEVSNYVFNLSSIYWDKNVRSLVVRLLNALKCFYTFKDLEELLNVPQQVLWRYVNFLTVPEEGTARRILNRIEELKLVEKIIEQRVRVSNGKVVEKWRFYENVGFLDIFSFYVLTIVRIDDVDTVLGFPEDSTALATSVAQWLRAYLCVATRNALTSDGTKYVTEVCTSQVTGRVEYLAVPRGCLEKGDLVLLVTDVLNDAELLGTAVRLVRKAQAEPWGLVAVAALPELITEARRYGIKNVKVLKLIT